MSSNKGEIREMIIGLQIDKCRNKMIGNTDCEPKDIAATCLKSIQEELQTRKRRFLTWESVRDARLNVQSSIKMPTSETTAASMSAERSMMTVITVFSTAQKESSSSARVQ